MRIVGLEFKSPALAHPNGGTIYEAAKELEERYGVIGKFLAIYKTQIEKIIAVYMAKMIKERLSKETASARIEEEVFNLWRPYILSEEHGIQTRASKEEGRQSFVDTGSYFSSLRPNVVWG